MLITQHKVNHIHPAQQPVEDGPAHRLPGGVADDHSQRAAEGDAALDGFLYDGLVLFFHDGAPFASGQRADEHGGARSGQFDLRPLADEAFVSREFDDKVVVQPPVDGTRRAARGLDKHAHGLADKGGHGGVGVFFLHGQQPLHAGGFLGARGGVVHFGGRGTLALGIDEGEQLHIADRFDQVERGLKVFFGLAGEADDDIARKGHAGDLCPRVVDEFPVLRGGVAAVHPLQDPVGAGLDRQVELVAYGDWDYRSNYFPTEGKWHLVGSSDWEPAKEIFNGTLRLKKDAGIHVLKDDFTVDHTEISAEELIGQYAEYGMDDSLDIFEKAYFCDFTLELNEEGEIVDLTENWKC